MRQEIFVGCFLSVVLFLLTIVSALEQDKHRSGSCGGLIRGVFSETITYNTTQGNQICIWTIVNEYHSDGLSVELLSAEFSETGGEYLELYALEEERGGALRRAPGKWEYPKCNQILKRVGDICSLATPILYIVFRTNSISNRNREFNVFIRRNGRQSFIFQKYYVGFQSMSSSGFFNFNKTIDDNEVYRETKLSWTIVPLVNSDSINSTPSSLTVSKTLLNKYYPESNCGLKRIVVYQLRSNVEPEVLGGACQIQEKYPLTMKSNSSEPWVVIFQDILYRPDTQYVQFYWNMKTPPTALYSGAIRTVLLNNGSHVFILLAAITAMALGASSR